MFFYQYDNTLEKMHKEREFLNCTPVKSQTITNGFILPLKRDVSINYSGGVVDSNRSFVAGVLRHHINASYEPICARSYEFDDYMISDESVLFGGVIIPHFGHFLIDSLSRLWYVVKNHAVINNYKIVFVGIGNIPSYVYETLELLGLKQDQVIFLDKVTKFKEIIVPEQSGYTLDFVHREYLTIYNEIALNSIQRYKGPKYKKIFLSRAKCKTGYKIIGEDYFAKFYSDHGFKVLYPDEMSIADKVAIVSSADEIVFTCGTISLYSLFANKNCKVVILNRNFNFCTYPQTLINVIKDYECHLIDCSCNFLYSALYNGVSLLYPTKYWIDYVQKTYNEEVPPMDSSYIFEYLKYFYQFYKNRTTFDFANEKFVKDFFERCGRLFFDEDFISLLNDKTK